LPIQELTKHSKEVRQQSHPQHVPVEVDDNTGLTAAGWNGPEQTKNLQELPGEERMGEDVPNGKMGDANVLKPDPTEC